MVHKCVCVWVSREIIHFYFSFFFSLFLSLSPFFSVSSLTHSTSAGWISLNVKVRQKTITVCTLTAFDCKLVAESFLHSLQSIPANWWDEPSRCAWRETIKMMKVMDTRSSVHSTVCRSNSLTLTYTRIYTCCSVVAVEKWGQVTVKRTSV